MSDRAVIVLATGCRWLQTLQIRFSSQRTDEFHIAREFDEFTDKGAAEVISSCRFLRSLDFSYNTKLKSLGLVGMVPKNVGGVSFLWLVCSLLCHAHKQTRRWWRRPWIRAACALSPWLQRYVTFKRGLLLAPPHLLFASFRSLVLEAFASTIV